MHAFEQTKREILARVDIVDLVSTHVKLKRAGRRFVGLCPFHSEKTPSFTVNQELGIFKCFGCGKGGDIFSFIQAKENLPFGEALAILADRAGVPLQKNGGTTEVAGVGRAEVAKVCSWAAKYFQERFWDESLGRTACQYMRGRGFTDDTLRRFGIGLSIDDGTRLTQAAAKAGFSINLLIEADLIRRGDAGDTYPTFRSRIMFPIRDAMQRVIGFGGRTLVDDRAKYLNTRQNTLFDKGRTLYGIDLARNVIGERGRAVIVEGYTDCMAAHQAGFPETVATLGTALTETHADLLRRYADRAIFLFDSDNAGAAAADRAIRVALPRSLSCRLARIPGDKDPSDFLGHSSASEFSDVLNGAVDALEFKWNQTRERFGGDATDARRRDAVLEFLGVLSEAVCARAVDAIQRGLLVNQAAHLLGIDRAEVDRLLRRLAPKSDRPGRSVVSTASGNATDAASLPPDGEQAAWARVLEVLLNEPSRLRDLEGQLDIERIRSERDRRIAGIVVGVGEQIGEYSLADVLARCSDPDDILRVCALAESGALRGNYEATLHGALSRLEQSGRWAKAAPVRGDVREALALRHAAQKENRQFVPHRDIRMTSGGPVGGA